MANIEMVYREGYCELGDLKETDYSKQCHTCVASDAGCPCFNDGQTDSRVVPFGDCIHAKFDTKYKGMARKRYDIWKHEDDYNPHLNCMVVSTGKREYDCSKVIVDGKVIYDEDKEE